MYIGVYNAVLADKSLTDALDLIAGLGLNSVEINSGGFLPPIQLPVEDLMSSEQARTDYLGEFSSRGLTLTALNCNGNPLFPREGFPHDGDLKRSIELAALLGVPRVVTMSGTPAGSPSGTNPVWNPLPWWSPFLDVRDHQWEVAVPYWRDIQARAADADVKVAIEMHPGNIVFNPASMHRLAEEINATHVGAEMDPSHLFWQGIDPVLALRDLGSLVYCSAAKDTRINEAAKINGVIDDSFTRVTEGEPDYVSLGPGTSLSGWPRNSSWDFVAIGKGHDVPFWTEFLRALQRIDADIPCNIEHEDAELRQVEGLEYAAKNMLAAEASL
ncbi:MAG: TIM barrel protein [Nostocoides sp.]